MIQHAAESRQTEAALVFAERFVRGQSIRQRPPGTATQNSRFGGVICGITSTPPPEHVSAQQALQNY